MNISRFTKSEMDGSTISPVLFGRKLSIKVKKNKTLKNKFNQYKNLIQKIVKMGKVQDQFQSEEVKKMFPMVPWVSLKEVSIVYQNNYKLRQNSKKLSLLFNRKQKLEQEINLLAVLASKDQRLIKFMKDRIRKRS